MHNHTTISSLLLTNCSPARGRKIPRVLSASITSRREVPCKKLGMCFWISCTWRLQVPLYRSVTSETRVWEVSWAKTTWKGINPGYLEPGVTSLPLVAHGTRHPVSGGSGGQGSSHCPGEIHLQASGFAFLCSWRKLWPLKVFWPFRLN